MCAARYLLGDRANEVLSVLAVATDLLALVLGVVVIAMAPWHGGRGIICGVFALLPALLLLVGYDVLTALLDYCASRRPRRRGGARRGSTGRPAVLRSIESRRFAGAGSPDSAACSGVQTGHVVGAPERRLGEPRQSSD